MKGTAYLETSEDQEVETPEFAVAAAESVRFQVTSLPAIADLQRTCEEIKLIKSGDKPKNTEFKTIKIDGPDIFCEVSSNRKPRPYIPKPMRNQIITSLHQMDHKGVKCTLNRVGEEFYWPSIQAD